MITKQQFLDGVDWNSKRIKRYKLGGDGTNGNCDCIGLDIGAIRHEGGVWPWTHGTNYTVRKLLDDGIHVNAVLKVGDVVFKGRQPGQSGYSLPDQYKQSGDLTDYYHVGTVISVNPLTIIHCTSGSNCVVWNEAKQEWVKASDGGIKFNNERGNWKYSGWLKMIQKDGEQPVTAKVISPNGGKVNMRKEPKTTAQIVAQLAVGTEVEVLGNTNTGWTRCQYNTKTGYIMSQFLTGSDSDGAEHAQIEQVKALLNQALGILDEMG